MGCSFTARCFLFAQSCEQEPQRMSEEPFEQQPLAAGMIQSLHVVTQPQQRDDRGKGFVVASETSYLT